MLSFKLSVCYPQSFYLSPPPIAFYLFNLFHVVSFYLSLSEISLPVIFCVIIIFFSFAGTFHLPAVISPTCIFYEIIPTIQITAQSISSDVYIIQVRYIIATVIHANGSLCIILPVPTEIIFECLHMSIRIFHPNKINACPVQIKVEFLTATVTVHIPIKTHPCTAT
ncbi:hypothetical protein DW640_21425 [Bacteroides sp. AM23-12]|uniref:Transmembrane protein n=1 Tax=Bacteroides thetaiotaomicron TaxID=818 RepID=A0A415LYL3_BACT4|nr:hypothetical protein [Bacteroides thetaiotaomicron]RGC83103.1 hypothetical protein DW640_21425 [Bacteroides sp. AM23-12]RGZ36601.1 hypothetical protein DW991_14065 [Bacteroides thetaiotaomicron]RHL57083.1 hypothetical protein DW011_15030 [Bacteroides thetaiotaomicron]